FRTAIRKKGKAGLNGTRRRNRETPKTFTVEQSHFGVGLYRRNRGHASNHALIVGIILWTAHCCHDSYSRESNTRKHGPNDTGTASNHSSHSPGLRLHRGRLLGWVRGRAYLAWSYTLGLEQEPLQL